MHSPKGCFVFTFPKIVLLGFVFLSSVWAQTGAIAPLPPHLRLPSISPALKSRKVPSSLSGPVDVVVRLSDPPLAAVAGNKRTGWRMTPAQQRAYVQQLQQKQSALMNQISGLGGTRLASTTKAYNALVVSIDSARLGSLKGLGGVASVRGVVNYRTALSEVVPYIGASALHAAGLTGTGIRVAVLDSGIDYTHRNLGGAGTIAAYRAAYGAGASSSQNKTRDGLFPTAKVIAGYDFVGEVWPDGPLAPDPDPIDLAGHGTHVADIIAGKSADGTHKGVAFEASLLAVKVCSAVGLTVPCSGIASLRGMDFALDPNGDDDLSDAVDVINLSLGSDFGQREDDLTEMTRIATLLGVVVVAAAGNGTDIPYVLGSPSSSPSVISVAQTQVPSALNYGLLINTPPVIAGIYRNTQDVEWAPIGTGFTNAEVVFVGRGCPAGSIEDGSPADPYLANPAGKVALIDRGACNASLKVDRAAKAGAIGVLIGMVAPGDAVGFSRAGGDTFVPTLVLTQATANLIKARLSASQSVRVTVNPSTTTPLVGGTVSTSSRGPGYSYGTIKPDIGAPGASISAQVGTGTGETAFGGTSGATPVVAGSAALLMQACPTCTPLEIKARLMNTADINVFTNPALNPGGLAPVTRVGAGEVRVNAAVQTKTEAWDAGDPESVSLSFGGFRLDTTRTLQKKVLVRNLSPSPRTYRISTDYRSAAKNTGAVVFSAPSSIAVPAQGSATFIVNLTVTAALLPSWNITGGGDTGNGALLDALEFDGFITISDQTDTIHVPWQILPHKAARLQSSANTLALASGLATLTLSNVAGGATSAFNVFSLTGTSPQYPSSALPKRGDLYAVIDLRATGTRLVNFGQNNLGIQFAINTWNEVTHPSAPAEFDIFIDTDGDGLRDVDVYTIDEGFFTTGEFIPTGRSLVVVQRFDPKTGDAVGAATPVALTDSDFNTTNIILSVPLAALNITPATKITYDVYVFDNYYTGFPTDAIENIVYTPGLPKFAAAPSSGSLAPGGSAAVTVFSPPGGAAASPSQSGLLILYRDALSGQEASIVPVTP